MSSKTFVVATALLSVATLAFAGNDKRWPNPPNPNWKAPGADRRAAYDPNAGLSPAAEFAPDDGFDADAAYDPDAQYEPWAAFEPFAGYEPDSLYAGPAQVFGAVRFELAVGLLRDVLAGGDFVPPPRDDEMPLPRAAPRPQAPIPAPADPATLQSWLELLEIGLELLAEEDRGVLPRRLELERKVAAELLERRAALIDALDHEAAGDLRQSTLARRDAKLHRSRAHAATTHAETFYLRAETERYQRREANVEPRHELELDFATMRDELLLLAQVLDRVELELDHLTKRG